MRIASCMADKGYTPRFHEFRVWIAGAERDNVIVADDTKRYAVTLARDEFGRPVLDKDGQQQRQPYYGDVRIERIHTDTDEDSGALGAAVWAICAHP
jgi:hypothetical protein